MDQLKEKFIAKATAAGQEVKEMLKDHSETQIGTVDIGQIFGGMRGIKAMVWEPSALDPQEGIRFRGYSIPELSKLLPTAEGDDEPLPEGLFWLMLVGEIPTSEEVRWLTDQWTRRSNVPSYVFKTLDALPLEAHPMTQLSTAVMAMQQTSVFARRYAEGMNRNEYWDATYEDTMNLIARLPRVAAYIYRRTYFDSDHIAPDISLDWAGNFAHMLGINKPDFRSLMRLYMTIHADHEGGNASAHTTHLIGSTLSDAYLSLAGGLNALAGPLHGLANQEVIKWIFKMNDALETNTPTEKQIEDYVKSTLSAGKVIPGYGHAVLRKPDPRFIAQMEFAKKYTPNSEIVETIWKVFKVVPPILESLGKVKNPWPNVDAHSGALLVHYGMDQYSFYTVLFGVSRALGVLSALCWSRALSLPLERPKSVTIEWVKEFLESENS
ncbi:MAG: citrate (Si)-synthase [Saprospiraceae bacterium]|nr:citrate (Si)-synthase [Saprospiraceae bacterium]